MIILYSLLYYAQLHIDDAILCIIDDVMIIQYKIQGYKKNKLKKNTSYASNKNINKNKKITE